MTASDPDVLEELIHLHAPRCGYFAEPDDESPAILDLTYGRGAFWTGLRWSPVTRLDRRPLPGVSHVGDFRDLMHVRDIHTGDRESLRGGFYDVVVFDPPHNAESGKNSRLGDRFGLEDESVQHVPDISHLFAPVLQQASLVLRRNGIVIAKLIDGIHRGRMRWQVADFVSAARRTAGMTACDRKIVPNDASGMTGPNWDNVRHLRRNDVFWIVVRRGGCVRPLRLACKHHPEWREGIHAETNGTF